MKRQKEFQTSQKQSFYLSEFSCSNGFKDVCLMLPLDVPYLVGEFKFLGSKFPTFLVSNVPLFHDTFGSDDLFDNLCKLCDDGLFNTLPSRN